MQSQCAGLISSYWNFFIVTVEGHIVLAAQRGSERKSTQICNIGYYFPNKSMTNLSYLINWTLLCTFRTSIGFTNLQASL